MSTPAPTLALTRVLSGAELLLTGFPGTLAQTVVALLLHEVPVLGHLHLVIPQKGYQSGQERFLHALARATAFRPLRTRFGEDLGTFLASRVSIHEGDIREPLCGLDASTREDLAERIDVVVHIPESTSELTPDSRELLERHVEGACHVMDLAARLPRARVLYLSSLQVHGSKASQTPEQLSTVSPAGRPFSPEAELVFLQMLACHEANEDESEAEAIQTRKQAALARADLHGFANTYAWGQALAEHLVLGRAARNPHRVVQTTLLRLGHLEAAERFPFPGFFDAYALGGALWAASQGMVSAVVGNPERTLALLPVDHAAQAILVLSAALLEGSAAPLYQLGSPGGQALSLDRALELQNLANRKALRQSPLPLQRHLERLIDLSAKPEDEAPGTPKRLKEWSAKVRAKLRNLDPNLLFPDPRSQQIRQIFSGFKVNAEWLLHEQQAQYTRSSHQLEQVQSLLLGSRFSLEQHELQSLVQRLDEESQQRFAAFSKPLNWRVYWMDILSPAYARLIPSLVSTQKAPEDPPFTLHFGALSEFDDEDEDLIELHEDSDPLSETSDWAHSHHHDADEACTRDHIHGPDCADSHDHDESAS